MAWRLARSLEKLRTQINEAYPDRSKVSDGTVGDSQHSSRASDHNPNSKGVVCALDITNDPAHGLNAGQIAEALRVSGDPRIKYLISNGRISNPDISNGAWRKYTGKNPHNHHFHISVKGDYDSTLPWDIGAKGTDIPAVLAATASPYIAKPLLKRGSIGTAVKELQTLLKITVDGDFGPKTEAAVKAFQKTHKLVPDGIAGVYTWEALT
jgi:peptidoglycan hydrolase-like protein with peptidoglycan-binding domain